MFKKLIAFLLLCCPLVGYISLGIFLFRNLTDAFAFILFGLLYILPLAGLVLAILVYLLEWAWDTLTGD